MYKIFFIILSLLVISNSTLANVSDKTIQKDLSKLENTFFNQNYKTETQQERIERLEYRVFGALQTGDTEKRLSNLKKASLNYRSLKAIELENEFYPTVQPSYTTQSGWKGVFGNLNNYFNGVPTGITPPIYNPPSNPNYYLPNSYKSPYSQYNSPYLFNNGYSKYYKNNQGEWYYSNTNSSSHTGITILD